MLLARIGARGFVIVCLTAMNVRQIAMGHYTAAFVVGCAISFTWWSNAHRAAQDVPGARWAYALGAGVGTVVGMYLGG